MEYLISNKRVYLWITVGYGSNLEKDYLKTKKRI